MNLNAWAGQIAAPLLVAAGILTCFWGYRIIKVTLGIMGFFAGAFGGWAVGLSVAQGNSGIALIFAIVGGLIGAGLCLWLFFLGIFLLGASAGAVAAAAFCNAAGTQPQPMLFVVLALVFGVIALVLQKLMIILSTAFTGSYLITAGILQLFTGVRNAAPLWFERLPPGSAGILGYATLVLWLLLGLAGVSFQYRGSRKRDERVRREAQPT
jgi:hypothetical protein